MADLNEYEALNGVVLSEDAKMLMEHFADVWEKCRADGCTACRYRHGKEYYQMLMCMSERYADELIAADVAPVRHGHWVRVGDGAACSECLTGMTRTDGIQTEWVDLSMMPFCPRCGAKMDKED